MKLVQVARVMKLGASSTSHEIGASSMNHEIGASSMTRVTRQYPNVWALLGPRIAAKVNQHITMTVHCKQQGTHFNLFTDGGVPVPSQ